LGLAGQPPKNLGPLGTTELPKGGWLVLLTLNLCSLHRAYRLMRFVFNVFGFLDSACTAWLWECYAATALMLFSDSMFLSSINPRKLQYYCTSFTGAFSAHPPGVPNSGDFQPPTKLIRAGLPGTADKPWDSSEQQTFQPCPRDSEGSGKDLCRAPFEDWTWMGPKELREREREIER